MVIFVISSFYVIQKYIVKCRTIDKYLGPISDIIHDIYQEIPETSSVSLLG